MCKQEVSGIGSITENITLYVDHHLKPIVSTLHSHLKDTGDFLKLLTDIEIPAVSLSVFWCSVPVRSHSSWIRNWTLCPFPWLEQIPTHPLLAELMSLVLTKTYFKFDDAYFRQCSGTAMGTRMAPNFANPHLGYVEKAHIINETSNPFFENLVIWNITLIPFLLCSRVTYSPCPFINFWNHYRTPVLHYGTWRGRTRLHGRAHHQNRYLPHICYIQKEPRHKQFPPCSKLPLPAIKKSILISQLHTVPSESIWILWLFPHFITLQPYSKMN